VPSPVVPGLAVPLGRGPWDFFGDWKLIDADGTRGVVALETAIRGTCAHDRLLDLVENFVAYIEQPRGLVKSVARNHQVLGVNASIDNLIRIRSEGDTRLGVFWHTQGSGKSLSMLWFTQKVLRRLPGAWTFVMVTDRAELDQQLHGQFADAGVISKEARVHAESAAHLRELLQADHRYVFTLIHKFRVDKQAGETTMPVLSDRRDVIVITDKAHRSQYDTLALNMRTALPHAAFMGFTGTPLVAGEELTRREFGDYVSVYNFRNAIEDGATVLLYYDNRIPELQLVNEAFADELTALLEEAELDEDAEGVPTHPLRLVFVCAMWMTGFDAPSVSTIYLDRPMRNHTLMQTIARANRVFPEKDNGLIVDYIGVFRHLERALAIYGAANADAGVDSPIQDKTELLAALADAVVAVADLCERYDVDVDELRTASGFAFIALRDAAVEALLVEGRSAPSSSRPPTMPASCSRRCCPTRPLRSTSRPWRSSGCWPNGSPMFPGHRMQTSAVSSMPSMRSWTAPSGPRSTSSVPPPRGSSPTLSSTSPRSTSTRWRPGSPGGSGPRPTASRPSSSSGRSARPVATRPGMTWSSGSRS